MRRLLYVAAVIANLCTVAFAIEGRRDDSILLNGQWQFVLGQGDEDVFGPDSDSELNWQPVTLPGRFVEWSQQAATSIRFVWARRSFQVSQAQAERLAILRWDRIVHGATAFINGKEVGRNEPMGPYQVLLPEGTLIAGKNDIVLKIPGGAGVRRAESGHFLFPAGQIWGPSRPQMPAVTQDVWIDFADRAYMKWVLAIPDMANKKVRIRVTLTGPEPLDDLTITSSVRPWPKGDETGVGRTQARLVPSLDPLGGEHFFVEVSLEKFKPWSPEDCQLYTAEVRLACREETLDVARVRFGMRQIEVVDGDYRLNGKRLWIRGSNLVHEWDWADIIKGKELAYLVTEAREMSMNAFRTHTQPPPRLWADICDEHGTMILAEFPILYNYRDHGYTAEEWEVFHRNAMLDTAGWMARLWNHPAVIMWVLSNESRGDNEWESGTFRDFVVGLDPTRPTMRTGTTGTKTNFDVHTCGNTNHWTHEGRMHTIIDGWFRQAGDRTVTNSEYMNIFNRPKCQWTGTEDDQADRLAYAQLGMEHTEAMRRARVDAILPYMYAGWTRTRRGGEIWKGGFAQPVSACWHSALSPVLASLELFDANYVTAQQVETQLYLINDSWHPADIRVDLLLTDQCPELLPEARCFEKPVSQWHFEYRLPADSMRKTPIKWSLPEREGRYWLTARTTGITGRPVLSQRFVRAVRPAEKPAALGDRTFVILGADAASDTYFHAKELRTIEFPAELLPAKHVVVVWNPSRLSEEEKQRADTLRKFADSGGHIVVLSTDQWNWRSLCDVRIGRTGGSRVFPYHGTEAKFLRGVNPECLQRWNGLPGTVAVACLEGKAIQSAEKFLWVREPAHTVVARIPALHNHGVVLFSQLDLRRRVLQSAANYDPVADQILLNLVTP